MLASSIGWILIISGIGTAAGGLATLFFPQTMLRLVFGAKISDGTTMFFVRHWGALLFGVCALTVYKRLRSHFSRSNLDGFHYRKDCHRCTDLLRANEADGCDDDLRNDGWTLGHPVRCISCGVLVPRNRARVPQEQFQGRPGPEIGSDSRAAIQRFTAVP
jgi:hypothetical protein